MDLVLHNATYVLEMITADCGGPAIKYSGSEFDDFYDRPAFDVIGLDTQSLPIVLNSPHSGSEYPERFLKQTRLDTAAIRASEDMDVDALFDGALMTGAVMQRARFPRAYLDINREPYELDTSMYDGDLPPFVNSRSIRVSGGLGTVAKIVAENRHIYAEKLDPNDALARVELVYRPYHDRLRKTLAKTHARFGFAVLLDCHSMPSDSRSGSDNSSPKPDIILGDRYGTSCSPELVEFAATIFREEGFVVARNKPYAGGFITEHYGRPRKGLHALQIEINRGLYMDESTLTRNPHFSDLKDRLTKFIEHFGAHTYFQNIEENPLWLAAE